MNRQSPDEITDSGLDWKWVKVLTSLLARKKKLKHSGAWYEYKINNSEQITTMNNM